MLDEQLPAAETPWLKETPEVRALPGARNDLLRLQRQGEHHRREPARAMSLAVDRQSIIDNITRQGKPADSFPPEGMPGKAEIVPEGSPWTPSRR